MVGSHTRRDFLTTATVALSSIAGCVSSSQTQTTTTPVTDASDNAPPLAWHQETKSVPVGTVYVQQDTIYASDYWGLYAFDTATGNQHWNFEIDEEQPTTDTTCYGQTFAVQNSTIYSGGCEAFHAIDAGNGTSRWANEKYTTDYTPALADNRVYLSSGMLVGLSTETGTKEWEPKTAIESVTAPALGPDTIYVGAPGGRIVAVDSERRTVNWTFQSDDSRISAPTVHDNVLVAGSGTPPKRGHVSALEATTGELRWQLATDAIVPNPPTVQDETVYTGTADGSVYAVDMMTGEPRWQFETAYLFTSRPTVTDDTVYVGSSHHLHAIERDTGNERWSVEFTGTITESVSFPVVTRDGSHLVVGTTTGLVVFSL